MKKGKVKQDYQKKYLNNYMNLFIIISLFSIVIFFVYCFFSQGCNLNIFFFHDKIDTGMDFFNSMIYLKGRHPYTQYTTIYPPLANLFFWILTHLVPRDEKALWPDTFEGSVAIRTSYIDLRVHQSTLLIFILFICILSITFIIVMSLYFNNAYYGFLCGVVLTFSYGWIFALERGNIITLSLIFLLVFLKFYKSDNPKIKELALIALAISAGFKIYPALFGILLLYEKNIKDIVKAIIYGIIFFFSPLFLFDGLAGIKYFVAALTDFANKDTPLASVSRYNISGIVKSICIQFGTLFEFDVSWVIYYDFKFITIFVIISIVIGLFVIKQNWKRILLIGILLIMAQASLAYTLIFLIPAFVFFVLEEKISSKTRGYFILLTLIFIPIPLMGSISFYNLNYITILGQDALLIMVLKLLVDIYVGLYSKLKELRKGKN